MHTRLRATLRRGSGQTSQSAARQRRSVSEPRACATIPAIAEPAKTAAKSTCGWVVGPRGYLSSKSAKADGVRLAKPMSDGNDGEIKGTRQHQQRQPAFGEFLAQFGY